MSSAKPEELTDLQKSEAKRDARKAKAQAAADAQKAIDLDAVSDIEDELGDASTKAIHLPHKTGLVTIVLVRCPDKSEIKRYRGMIKPDKKGRPGDAAEAHELIGASCRVYPPDDDGTEGDSAAFDKLCEAFPGLLGQSGMQAVALSVGEEEKEGKG